MDGGLFPGVARSNRKEVRNPLLTLPAAEQMRALPPMARKALEALLRDMGRDARTRAHECWRKNKAPMAAYWKAVAVYCRHAALTLHAPLPNDLRPEERQPGEKQ